MKIAPTILVLCIMLAGSVLGCQNINTPVIRSAFGKSLVQRKIKGTTYYLSLPANYIIKENTEIDFSVYYFYSSDTTDKKSFRGGFYLGNAPNGFGRDYDSCKVEKLHSPFLGMDKVWTVYNCNGHFSAQIITDSKSGMDWARYIHAFGKADSKTEINKLLEVYSTLTKK